MRQLLAAVTTLLVALAPQAVAQGPPDLSGVYQAIANDRTLAGGLRNIGSPADIVVVPAAAQQMRTIDLKQDPAKMCQPIGPFRMMARERTRIEIAPALAHGLIVMLFEDVAHGLLRTMYLNRAHPAQLTLNWMGDSVGRWNSGVLVVDTVGFNERTWLNDAGAQHSDALHLVEQIRPILGGKYLEYKVTAEDPKALAKPYTYTRYYEKVAAEIMEDICEEGQ